MRQTVREKRDSVARQKVFGKSDVDKILDMTLGEFLAKFRPPSVHYIVARKGTKLYNILKAIATGHPLLIIVVDEERRPIGYISELELLRTFSRRQRYSFFIAGFNLSRLNIPIEQALDVPVEKIMEDRPLVVTEKNKIKDILNLIRSLNVSVIIVVDDKKRLKTVLTASHLARSLLSLLLGEPFQVAF
ncbi:CBS domain-containing protein [Desulfurococcaceae archaeon MEX13E-LK6-19]|nr:CBS domain-containing protein [Desulfurococcaceae archaeon MEX13E-LK6-19]